MRYDDDDEYEFVRVPKKKKRKGKNWFAVKIYAVCVVLLIGFIAINAIHGATSQQIRNETERSRELGEQHSRMVGAEIERNRKAAGFK
ncbi:unnamed protein product [Gemmata massiliana]|uniref:Uncharacterized protein n=1 Tax=Gemmata massiliana TaxID=1210884 RepID=A0A6P2D3P5_9BACT|nr:hypothetical protein [Gemmata massiliana]VTR94072.1 unnamed protein product [Gemmata massiliana]